MALKMIIVVAAGIAVGVGFAKVVGSGKGEFWRDPFTLGMIGGVLAFAIAGKVLLTGPVVWAEPVNQIVTVEQFDAFIANSAEKPVLVDFYATWCMPCRMTAPNLNTVASKGHRVAVVDVDALPELAQRYQITGIPALLVFRNGTVAQREAGYHSAEDLQKLVEG